MTFVKITLHTRQSEQTNTASPVLFNTPPVLYAAQPGLSGPRQSSAPQVLYSALPVPYNAPPVLSGAHPVVCKSTHVMSIAPPVLN